MTNTILIIALLAAACTNQKEKRNETDLFETENAHEKLSEVIEPLSDNEVSGYVVISTSAAEYSSVEMAREDKSEPKSIVELDVERFDYHTPDSIENDRFYNWGSSLICRKVIADHGDVVEVLTLDPDEDIEKLGHGTLGADYLFRLKTFLRKKDLVPVLGSDYKLEFENKTHIKLEEGVAVGIPWGGGQSKRAVSIQHLHFEFSVPDSLLALSYQLDMKRLSEIKDKKMLNKDAILFLNMQKLCKVSEIRNDRLRTPTSYQKVGDKYLVELVENGIHLSLLTDLNLVESYIPNIERPILTNKYNTPPSMVLQNQRRDSRLLGEW